MKKMEILAPAGSMEALKAAVRSGANAVYLGQKDFSARKNSQNFSPDELKEATAYAHLYGAKVHQALNIVVFDKELERLKECIRYGDEAGIDAFIVQDLGVARLIREFAPHIPLHASTQLAIHSVKGVEFAKKAGFSRVVLARELAENEIRAIRESTDLELEAFVHGAHCMSVSGQCYFSAMLGGKSGNRGRCAQPCRLPFSAVGKGEYALSLKDLSLISKMSKLSALGVESLKIEGRMKRPEYVASAVRACVQAINGELPDYDLLRKVFSRDGFTSAYFDHKLTKEMFGTRQKEDVAAAQKALPLIANSYRAEQPLVGLAARFLAKKGEPLSLTLSDGTRQASSFGSCPLPAENAPTTAEDIRSKLCRLGGTPYYIADESFDIDDGLFVPASALNALRREATDELSALRQKTKPQFADKPFPPLPERKSPSAKPALWGQFSSAALLPKSLSSFERVVLPAKELGSLPFNERFVPSLPRFTFSGEKELAALLCKLFQMGYREGFADSAAGLELLTQAGMKAHGGIFFNLTNSYAVGEIEKLGACSAMLSPEGRLGDLKRIKTSLSTGILAYGYFPLMAFRSCPVKAQVGCKNCGGKGFLTDRRGVKFPVRCEGEMSFLYNSLPLFYGDKQEETTGFDRLLLSFTIESPKEAEEVLAFFERGIRPPFPITRGLYERGVE